MLEKVFEPTLPKWSTVLGVAAVEQPIYAGSRRYRIEAGPVIDIRYYDIAFASVGEGLGVNLLRGETYRAGVAVGYDLGRRVQDDYSHLHGLGDIRPAPMIKLFGSWVLSKQFPMDLRADVREIVGRGAHEMLADVDAFMPLPGSSKTFVMFAGPSITFANGLYTQKTFGVSAAQSAASGYRTFDAHGGANAIGLGFSATRFITPHWLINSDLAVNRLLGGARDSPITQTQVANLFEITTSYRW